MTDTPLQTCDADGVRTLTLNRPQRRNALDTALAGALLEALRAADQDPAVGAVLIAGNGPVFCAGADLGEFKGEQANPQAEAHRSDLFLDLQLAFDELQLPLVCAVTGPAVGAGAALAIAADLTVMGENARLSWPEIAHGMVPSLMVGHLQRRTGRKLAFELLVLGEAIGARDALAAGLANRVVPDVETLAVAARLAHTLASRDRAALRETKQLFARSADLSLSEALRTGREAGRARHARAVAGTRID